VVQRLLNQVPINNIISHRSVTKRPHPRGRDVPKTPVGRVLLRLTEFILPPPHPSVKESGQFLRSNLSLTNPSTFPATAATQQRDAVFAGAAGANRQVHERQAGTSCSGSGCRHILCRAVLGASTRGCPNHNVSWAPIPPLTSCARGLQPDARNVQMSGGVHGHLLQGAGHGTWDSCRQAALPLWIKLCAIARRPLLAVQLRPI